MGKPHNLSESACLCFSESLAPKACNKDEDYAPTNAPTAIQTGPSKKSPVNGKANGKPANGTQEIELDSKPPKGKAK